MGQYNLVVRVRIKRLKIPLNDSMAQLCNLNVNSFFLGVKVLFEYAQLLLIKLFTPFCIGLIIPQHILWVTHTWQFELLV